MKKKKVLVFASLLIIVLICIAFTTRTLQNDTFYNIKIGKWILKHGVDMKEHFTWHSIKEYTYPHWLFDVMTYKVYYWGGVSSLYIVSVVIFISIGVLFYFMNLKQNKSYFLSLLFSILAMIMLARFITPRAQLLTYLLFLIEIYLIEKLLLTNYKRYGIGLLALCILIANIHAPVWPFYFVLMLPYLFEYIVKLIMDKIKHKPKLGIFVSKLVVEKEKNIKSLIVVFVISLFCGLVTPIGFTAYTYFIKIMMGNTMEFIEEHQPLVLVDNLFVVGYLVIMFGTLIFTKVKVRLSDAVMMLGLLFMAFLGIRHIALLGVIGMYYLCRLICNIGYINGNRALDYDLPWYGIIIVTITIIVTTGFVYKVNAKGEYIDANIYPVEMVDYIKDNLDLKKIRLYNDYDIGSYLIYKDIPVYIDSRSDIYTKPFNHKEDIFDDCMHITERYGRVFNKYNITHILVIKKTDLNQILSASPNYELIKKAGRFALYEYVPNNEEDKE